MKGILIFSYFSLTATDKCLNWRYRRSRVQIISAGWKLRQGTLRTTSPCCTRRFNGFWRFRSHLPFKTLRNYNNYYNKLCILNPTFFKVHSLRSNPLLSLYCLYLTFCLFLSVVFVTFVVSLFFCGFLVHFLP